jgi:hypothetical protein
MKEFIEKLIGRLEEARDWYSSAQLVYCHNPVYVESFINREAAMNLAIEIVNQLAEEYKGGWIACGERLPEVATCYLVTEEVTVNSKKQYVTDIRLFGTEDEWLCPSNRKIIAWQPLPSTYKEGNNDEN